MRMPSLQKADRFYERRVLTLRANLPAIPVTDRPSWQPWSTSRSRGLSPGRRGSADSPATPSAGAAQMRVPPAAARATQVSRIRKSAWIPRRGNPVRETGC